MTMQFYVNHSSLSLSLSVYLLLLDEWSFILDERRIILDQWSGILVEWCVILDKWIWILDEWSIILDEISGILDEWSFILDERRIILDKWSIILDKRSGILDERSGILDEWSIILEESSVILLFFVKVNENAFLDAPRRLNQSKCGPYRPAVWLDLVIFESSRRLFELLIEISLSVWLDLERFGILFIPANVIKPLRS